jgi:hypothetical protein
MFCILGGKTMHKSNNNRLYNNSFNNSLDESSLNNPAILSSSDVSALRRLQDEFQEECGKNVILVAYKG